MKIILPTDLMPFQTTRPSYVMHLWLPFIFYMTLKLVVLGFQSPLFVGLGIYLLSHLPFQSSKLDWSFSEQIQNDRNWLPGAQHCAEPRPSPFALVSISNFKFFPIPSWFPPSTKPTLLKLNKDVFRDGFWQVRKLSHQTYPKAHIYTEGNGTYTAF